MAGMQWGEPQSITGVSSVASGADGFLFGTGGRRPFIVDRWAVETDNVQDGFGLIANLRIGAVLTSASASWTAGRGVQAVLPSQEPVVYEVGVMSTVDRQNFVIRSRNLTTLAQVVTISVFFRELESYDEVSRLGSLRYG